MLPLQFMFYFIFSFFHSLHTFYAYATLFSIDMEITAISQKLTDHVRAYRKHILYIYWVGKFLLKYAQKMLHYKNVHRNVTVKKKFADLFKCYFRTTVLYPYRESHKNVIVPLQGESHKNKVVPLQEESHKKVVSQKSR